MLHFTNESTKGQAHDLHIGESIEPEFDIVIRVHHDTSYGVQSWAKCEVWCAATLSWNRISDLLPLEIHDVWEAADELRARAAAVLIG
jgi:hypothetical protein